MASGALNSFMDRLPGEIFVSVLDYLSLKPDLIRSSQVSRAWRDLFRGHPTFWKKIKVRDVGIGGSSVAAGYDLADAQLSLNWERGRSDSGHSQVRLLWDRYTFIPVNRVQLRP